MQPQPRTHDHPKVRRFLVSLIDAETDATPIVLVTIAAVVIIVAVWVIGVLL